MVWIQGTSANISRCWGSEIGTSINVDRGLPPIFDRKPTTIRGQKLTLTTKPKRENPAQTDKAVI